jgi:hypothetical protein
MDERIHKALDGELPEEQLTDAERVAVTRYREMIGQAVGVVRTVAVPDLTGQVMARVHAIDTPAARPISVRARLTTWLWQPVPVLVTWRPAYAAILLMALAIGTLTRPDVFAPTLQDAATPAASTIYVQFRLDAPGATSVQVVGSFTEWEQGVDLVETTPGVWATLLPLEPGVHDYTFIIDGDVWVVDPLAPSVDDGFGGSKSRLFLTSPLENA